MIQNYIKIIISSIILLFLGIYIQNIIIGQYVSSINEYLSPTYTKDSIKYDYLKEPLHCHLLRDSILYKDISK